MKSLHFLSGLPRSGSTVLAALLNQHPQIKATSTSGLIGIMGAVCAAWEGSPTKGDASTAEVHRLLRSVVEGK